jgi:hypothetical protein
MGEAESKPSVRAKRMIRRGPFWIGRYRCERLGREWVVSHEIVVGGERIVLETFGTFREAEDYAYAMDEDDRATSCIGS